MGPYVHTVQYYETDKMGIVHHSNYVRWMEEARVDFLRQIGWGFEKLEAEGLVSPVVSISGRYRVASVFPEEITIRVSVAELRGAVLKLEYLMTNSAGTTVFEGTSEHCFLGGNGRVVRLRNVCPELYGVLASLAAESGAGSGGN
ncbi:MAG: acyl-CoA thioesterase [Oscillospiraceae bacterium]|nr:acyl-CoA thioesterase [Oscillospiraceae bacterium]